MTVYADRQAQLAAMMARRERSNTVAFEEWIAERNRREAHNPPRKERPTTVERELAKMRGALRGRVEGHRRPP